MSETRYFIVQKDDGWVIRFGGDDFGPYQTKREAMLFAVDAAQQLGEKGQTAEVCLVGENGHFLPEWTFGRDAYPPRL